MNDDQLLRYSRHILLPEIGIDGQQKINGAHALIIGAGGLGSPAVLYLASAGVGTLTIWRSVDLVNWTPVGSVDVTDPNAGASTFIDQSAIGIDKAYYKAQ